MRYVAMRMPGYDGWPGSGWAVYDNERLTWVSNGKTSAITLVSEVTARELAKAHNERSPSSS